MMADLRVIRLTLRVGDSGNLVSGDLAASSCLLKCRIVHIANYLKFGKRFCTKNIAEDYVDLRHARIAILSYRSSGTG